MNMPVSIPNNRLPAIDYLKAIAILLMVSFHLVIIETTYPYVKNIIYTFHMPLFFLLSGYLWKMRPLSNFFHSLGQLLIPYLIFETLYIFAAFLLPINQPLTHLSVPLFLRTLLLHPIGPYWFLHSLVLLSLFTYLGRISCYLLHRYQLKLLNNGGGYKKYLYSEASSLSFLLSFISLSLLDNYLNIPLEGRFYFLSGVFLRYHRYELKHIFQPHILLIPIWIVLVSYPHHLTSTSLAGIAITYSSISILLIIYIYLPAFLQRILHFIGRNTLAVLCFSPAFTLISQYLLPYFSFDSSHIIFAMITLLITFSGCYGMASVLDKSKLGALIFLKKPVLLK